MNNTTIQLTPPIDGVQYGYSETERPKTNTIIGGFGEKGNGDVIWNSMYNKVFKLSGDITAYDFKILFSTNPKDLRFPFLQLPSKIKTLDKLAEKSWDEINGQFKDGVNPYAYVLGFVTGHNTNPAKYTQEQMEKAINLARCGLFVNNGIKDLGTTEIIQSLQPTAKAVVVEMETVKDFVRGFGGAGSIDIEQIKVEQSTKYPQGVVRGIDVIY